MSRSIFASLAVMGILALGCIAEANSFYADTDQLGYVGTVQNITQDTPPVATSIPRDADIFVVNNAPSYSPNYTIASSLWYEQPISNQNNSFFQLYDGGQSALTEHGAWDITGTTFTMTVTGANAPYDGTSSYSRLWQPDQNDAWGGTFLNYTLTLTATFDAPAALVGDVLTSQGNLVSMTGNFSGTFMATQDVNKNPIANGDTYGFNLDMSYASFLANQVTDPIGDHGNGLENSTSFGQVVPLPNAAYAGLGLIAGLMLVGAAKRRRRVLA